MSATPGAPAPRFGAVPPRHRSGFVVIIGRPNAGKSTLLNCLLGRKIAIVTPKPQTTRRRLLGIRTLPQAQVLFVDTPGIHRARDLMNRRMVERAKQSLADADVVLWVVDADRGLEQPDDDIVALLPGPPRSVVVALNKIDSGPKERLLPIMERIAAWVPDREVIPVSARTGENDEVLLRAIETVLPEGPRYYPIEEITDASEREIVAEIIREKLMLATREEIPYAGAVTIDAFEEKSGKRLVIVKASVHVERPSQKAIVIGQGGRLIKSIGQAARVDIERLLGVRVFLELFVRVQSDWTKRVDRLREFGV